MSDIHQAAARLLREAYSGGAVPPLRDYLEPVDIAGAYAVQEINTRFWQAQGRRIVERKAGLTAKAVQSNWAWINLILARCLTICGWPMAGSLIPRVAFSQRRRPRSPLCWARM
jgi:2-keto-4-pentenoate hydratase